MLWGGYMMGLSGTRVFITGAGSGIGYQIALAFARNGANVIVSDIDMAGLEKLAAEPVLQSVELAKKELDVRDIDAYRALIQELVDADTIPDIVVNNAGLGVFRKFTDTSLEDWKLTLDVNVMGVVHGCKLFSEVWLARKMSGHIVNLSSMASLAPIPNMSAYVASKMAVEGLSDVLNMEYSDKGIFVTCVHPGIIDTPIMRHDERYGFSPERVTRIQKYYREKGVLPRVVAEDVVKAVTRKSATLITGTDVLKVIIGRKILPRKAFLKLVTRQARKIGFLPRKDTRNHE
ncbi:MAG TPA: SDR family NAD(P)-dependent oxidoreductase [Rhodobacteraceae bacterium]|nr:SDR family NAD(P)-dependent oxidoreductase [Paracoccaceae bacterium]